MFSIEESVVHLFRGAGRANGMKNRREPKIQDSAPVDIQVLAMRPGRPTSSPLWQLHVIALTTEIILRSD